MSTLMIFPSASDPPASALARVAARCLLVLVTTLAALSADQAERLGLTALRIPAFIAAAVGLILMGLAAYPTVDPRRACTPILLFLLLGVMALMDLQGPVDPIDYKLVLPVLAMFAAGSVARLLGPIDLPCFLWRMLALYVLATAAVVLQSDPGELVRGANGITRIDASGSLVTHTAFCSFALVLSAATWRRAGILGRLLRVICGALAMAMLLGAATRTPFLTFAIAGLLLLAVAPDRGWWARAMLLAVGIGAAALLLHTSLVDDSLWRRIWSDGQPEWSTGRMVAVDHWLSLSADHPFGLGLGSVRATLADGKPSLDGDDLLDWPHDEAIRLWVEAGPVGLLFLLLLLGTITGHAIWLCRHHPDLSTRLLAVMLAADAIAQSLFQNWLNSIYHATFGVLVICLLRWPPSIRRSPATSGLTPRHSSA